MSGRDASTLEGRFVLTQAVFSATERLEAGTPVRVTSIHRYRDGSEWWSVKSENGVEIHEISPTKFECLTDRGTLRPDKHSGTWSWA
jgi:hypothetical protein